LESDLARIKVYISTSLSQHEDLKGMLDHIDFRLQQRAKYLSGLQQELKEEQKKSLRDLFEEKDIINTQIETMQAERRNRKYDGYLDLGIYDKFSYYRYLDFK
jgi:hypothetical protein